MFAALQIEETIYRTPRIHVLRAQLHGQRLIVKTGLLTHGVQLESARLRYEFELLHQVAQQGCDNLPSDVQLLQEDGTLGIAMGDVGGCALRDVMPSDGPTVLHVGMAVARALQAMHAARVVHKDVNPNNIVFNAQTGAVQLVDLSIATRLVREHTSGDSVHALEGTLPYMSPEQTGRVSRGVDLRTDLYSLGVTLYEMLCGALPFASDDPLELVYAILATRPPPLASRAPHAPPMLCAVVERLLHKSPDERYQSAHGVLADLQRCAQSSEPTVLGLDDRIEHLLIPQKLYGREAEVEQLQHTLLSHLETPGPHAKLVFLAGAPGIGKTALQAELRPTLLHHRALNSCGKHDALGKHIPLAAVRQALSALVHQLLQEPKELCDAWRRRVRGALGNVGGALLEMLPDLTLLVGPQKAVPPLGPREAENRLLMLLQRLVEAVCAHQPLMLFLDDLQWADSGTFKWLQLLCTQAKPGRGLLILGAYRDTEVDAAHPLRLLYSTLLDLQVPASTLAVGPLSCTPVRDLLADCTRLPTDAIAQLADLIWQKSGGSPFFMHALLGHLWDHNLLRFDAQQGRFTWDMAALRAASIPDDVVHLMTQRITQLPADDAAALSWAACVGDVFSLEAAAHVGGVPRAPMAVCLGNLLQAGFIVPQSNAYRYAAHGELDAQYKFVHDHVRQAAHARLDAATAMQAHLKMGQLLRVQAPGNVFAILEHLNAAMPCITDAETQHAVAQLNIQAAESAKRAAAYGVALEHLRVATALLPANLQQADASLYARLQLAWADTTFLSGDNAPALACIDALLPHTTDPVQQAQLHLRRVDILSTMGRHNHALDATAAGLACVGVALHVRSPAYAAMQAWVTWQQPRAGDSLLLADVCKDPRINTAMALLGAAVYAAYQTSPLAFITITLTAVRLTMRHGRTPHAALAYACLSVLLATLHRYRAAKRFADLASTLAARHATAHAAAVNFTCTNWADVLFKPPKVLAAQMEQGYIMGRETGENLWAGLSACGISGHNYSVSVVRMGDAADAYMPFIRSTDTPPTVMQMLAFRQIARCLRGLTRHSSSFDDAETVEAEMFVYAHAPGPDYAKVNIPFSKLLIGVVHRHLDMACDMAHQVLPMGIMQLFVDAQQVAYCLYALLAASQRALGRNSRTLGVGYARRLLRRLRTMARQDRMFGGEVALVHAELAQLRGDRATAVALYGTACATLQNAGFTDRLALAHECTGRFFMACGHPTAALAHLRTAHDLYDDWGASVKVQALASEFAALQPRLSHVSHPATHTTGKLDSTLAFATFMEAAQAIASERILGALVQQILHGVQRCAGATRALLLLPGPTDFVLAAHTPGPSDFPTDVITAVARSQTRRVLRGEALRGDSAFVGSDARAVLCEPILHQGQVRGVLYLENNLSADAFADGEVAIVTMLAAQAAVAMQNADTVAHLEEQVTLRTQELHATHARMVRLEKDTTESQMAGGFAHEIRNALGAANMSLVCLHTGDGDGPPTWQQDLHELIEALQQPGAHSPSPTLAAWQQLEAQFAALTSNMADALQRALHVTDAILEYARAADIVAGDDAVSLYAVVTAVLQEQAKALAALQIETRAEIPLDVQVLMRAPHAHTVLRNLIVNARDAIAAAGTPQRHIYVHASHHAQGVLLQVQDTGVGMPMAVQERVFQPFFSTKGTHGQGLGLGLSRKLMRVYGGELSFTSAEGQGSVFSVLLPVQGKLH